MEANRDSAPDAIPEHIVAQHLREAQITVVSSHYLRSLTKHGLAHRLYARVRFRHSVALIPLSLLAIAFAALISWIAVAPESTPLFVIASVIVVSATVALIHNVWQWVCSYRAASETMGEGTDH